MSKKVLHDSEVPGGTTLRNADRTLSDKLGGYRSQEAQEAKHCTSFYGNRVEPILHALEHTRRAIPIANGSFSVHPAEFARAKDELKTVGNGGLLTNDHSYQQAAQDAAAKK